MEDIMSERIVIIVRRICEINVNRIQDERYVEMDM
jgi:hypothetical protein